MKPQEKPANSRPTAIQIGPIRYRIEYVFDLHDRDGEKVDGQAYPWEALIVIEARLDPQEQRVTIWHEALHAVLRQAGYIDDEVPEQILESLGYGIQGLLCSNDFLRELP